VTEDVGTGRGGQRVAGGDYAARGGQDRDPGFSGA
jgi:hypothetical protein